METTIQRRGRRACEPCRRKKSKCPGERPRCSHCRRLGQACDYSFDERETSQTTRDDIMGRRIGLIENKLDQLLESLRSNQVSTVVPDPSSPSPPSPTRSVDIRELSSSNRIRHPSTSAREPFPENSLSEYPLTGAQRLPQRDNYVSRLGQLYLTWCQNQPLPLFQAKDFAASLETRDYGLFLAIQTWCNRFPPEVQVLEKRQSLEAEVKSSRQIVMNSIAEGNVKLSTLQTLCIISLLSFADGNVMQAGLDLSQAQYLANCLSPDSFLGDPIEYDLCIQSISLLHSIQGSIHDASNAKVFISELNYRSRDPFHRLHNEPEPDSGIVSHSTMVAETWQMARAYAAYHVGPDELPPWDPRSHYSHIMLRHMEMDARIPLKYRFATSNFGALSLEEIQQRRDHWGPWLFQQFTCAAISSLVNHPFLLSMRLKNYRHAMPQTFLHQSYVQISRCCAWTMHYLHIIEKVGLQVSDPSIAHCVTITATIHLQHSFVQDEAFRQKAQNAYNACLRFLDRVGHVWLSASAMAQNLRKLQESIVMRSYPSEPNGENPRSNSTWCIDAQLLWHLLIYERAGRFGADTDKTLFSDRITLKSDQSETEDVAEFAMVGCAGISGHKTVPVEVIADAPDESETFPLLGYSPTPSSTMQNPLEANTDFVFGSAGDMNHFMDQSNILLQEDFGKAIGGWINFNAM